MFKMIPTLMIAALALSACVKNSDRLYRYEITCTIGGEKKKMVFNDDKDIKHIKYVNEGAVGIYARTRKGYIVVAEHHWAYPNVCDYVQVMQYGTLDGDTIVLTETNR